MYIPINACRLFTCVRKSEVRDKGFFKLGLGYPLFVDAEEDLS